MELKELAEFVREMRALGATLVCVGEVEVDFGSVPETAKADAPEARPTTVRDIASRQGIGPLTFPTRVD